MNVNRGFSLIEVMVTLVLMCIGVLGMVALQSRSLQYTQDSVQRNTAAALAADLVELIRTGSSNGVIPAGYLKAEGASFPSAPADGCGSTTVSASEQLACWSQRASKLLPGAEGLLNSKFHVCKAKDASGCDEGGTGSAVEIQLAWEVKQGECLDAGDTNGSTSTICRYRLRTQI